MHTENNALLTSLRDCIEACNHCFDACLREENVKMLARCIRTDRDCADICSLTYKSVCSGSEFTPAMKKLCAEICHACAQECNKHEHEHCKRCAEACTNCEKACLEN